MNFNDILKQKNITKYRLSKTSLVPFATISDISTGKARIDKCSADTIYKLANALGVTMEDLVEESMEYRSSFETFKSNVCHMVHDMGDLDFIIDTLESDRIRKLYQKRWYRESLYLLAMVDYLSRENKLPISIEYSDIRKARLREPIYPASIIAMSVLSKSEYPKQDSLKRAIPEFKRFNIVESEVRNVI
jgi:transcriptional regulator with XRE-family HTH domain